MATSQKRWGVADDDTPETVTNAKLNQMVDYADEQSALSKLFAQDADTTTGLVFGYQAGRVKNGATVTVVAASTITLTGSATNYIEVDSAGTVSKNTTAFTSTKKPIGVGVTDGASITSYTDKRVGFDFSSAGDVTGAGSSTDNAIARFDGTGGATLQNSAITVSDTGAVTVPEISAPSTPASGKVVMYAKADGLLYSKDDAGTETQLGLATSGDMLKSSYDANNDGKIDLAAGGTGASTQSGARTALGLGTAAVKDYPASGNASGSQVVIATDTRLSDARTPSSHTHAASAITSGTIDQDRLGSGSGGTGAKFLADDQTWVSPSTAPPTVFAGGTVSGAFDVDVSDGTDQRFYLTNNATMSIIGTPVDGRVYELSFIYSGAYTLTLPSTFSVVYDDAYASSGTIAPGSGSLLTILAQYIATSHTGGALTGANGPYFRCVTMTNPSAPI